MTYITAPQGETRRLIHELEMFGYFHMALQQPLGTRFASTIEVLA